MSSCFNSSRETIRVCLNEMLTSTCLETNRLKKALTPLVRAGVFSTVATSQARPAESTTSNASRNTLHARSEEHTSELQSHSDLVCRLLLEKKNASECKT